MKETASNQTYIYLGVPIRRFFSCSNELWEPSKNDHESGHTIGLER